MDAAGRPNAYPFMEPQKSRKRNWIYRTKVIDQFFSDVKLESFYSLFASFIRRLWRHRLAELSDIRRCLAPDLLAHGDTEIAATQDVSVTANATMLGELLDALHIDQVDLVGNDSGGGIAQIFAARHPQRVRSLTLTNCDAHDNWPPAAFKPFLEMAAAGGLPETLGAMQGDKAPYRSPRALGPAYEHPERVTDETIDLYLKPHLRTAERTRDLERFLAAFDPAHTVAVEPALKKL